MLSIQKCQKQRSVDTSSKFRFTHQTTKSTTQFNKKQKKLSPVPGSILKNVCHHSQISSVKFRYLHKFDWQKLEKKFEIIEKLQKNKQKSFSHFYSSLNFSSRQRSNSIGLKFELLLPDQIKMRNHSTASCSPKSATLAIKKEVSMKQKLQYRLNEHKKFISEFGINQNEKQRLQKVKKTRDTLSKKPAKRTPHFHKPDRHLQ